MKDDDLSRVEGIVRDANPLPRAGVLVDSEESAAVTLLLRRATEMDVPGLLPVPPDQAELPESERTMDTLERIPVQEMKRPAPRRTAAVAFAAVILIAAVVGVGSLIIADGDGDVVSAGQAAPPDITFVDPDAHIFTYETTIRQLIVDTYAQAEPLLNVDGVAFSVSLEIPGLPIPDYGLGYSMADVNMVVLAIDPWFPGLSDVLPERLPVMVASALYDIGRSRGGASDDTFFETLVWSGLADHFAEELLGSPPPWTNAFPATRTEDFTERARPLFDTRWDDRLDLDLSSADRAAVDTAYDEWFYFGGADVPRWAGQTLGYRLIETYQAENPGQTAADLVNTPASVFRP